MRKRDELTDGCMAKALDDEMTFVLLGRDTAAPVAIRAWIAERIRTGKNQPGDPKLVEAEECARIMEAERLKAVNGERPYHAESGEWGSLPAEPCRFCRKAGGVHFLIDDGPEGRSGLSPVRCDLCGRSWVPDSSSA